MPDTSKQIKFIILTTANFNPETLTVAAVTNKLSESNPPLYDSSKEIPIVYIESQKVIYLNGTFYGTSVSDLTSILSAISALQTAVGASTDTAAADGSIYARITKLVNDLSTEVSNREDAVSTLETNVRAFTVNGEAFGASGAITIDANEIQIGSTLPFPAITGVTNTSTVTYALSQLKQDIIDVATGLTAGASSSADAAAQAMAEARKHTQVTAGTGITVSHTAATDNIGNIYTVSVNDTIATKAEVTAAATGAYTQAITDLTGATTDAITALTIYGARNYAKDLVDNLSNDLTGLSTAHLELIEQIKREMSDPSGASGIVNTFLDKLLTVGAGFNGIDGGTEGASGTIKNYIDTNVAGLSAAISAAQSGADDSIKSINGLTGDANGAVTVGATDILMTDYAAATGAVDATDSVLIAIAKVEGQAIDGASAAAAAQSTADTAVINAASAQSTANTAVNNASAAQTTADNAMGLLTWVIV